MMRLYEVSRRGASISPAWLEAASRVNVEEFRRVFERVEKFERVVLNEADMLAFKEIAPTLQDWDPGVFKISLMAWSTR